MIDLFKYLSPTKINIEDLLLDPNNPRFSELGEDLITIPESRYSDLKVQQNTFERMKDGSFDILELKDTIKTIGYLPMDRIVVRKWKGKPKDGRQKFVIIEGNRRISALKWLLQLHEIGKETFNAEQLKNYKEIEALVLDDNIAPNTALLILPGLRHISGIKEWGPYQKAKAVFELRKSGMPPQDVAQSIGLSTRKSNQAYRCYLALEQMKSDEEFGEYAEPRLYSYFEEAFKPPNVKKWLGWDEKEEKFNNDVNIREFYSWIIPLEGNDPKLPEAKSVRDLAQFIDDDSSFKVFRSPDGSLARALAKYEVEHPEDWFPKIISASDAIKSLTPEMLRKLDEESLNALVELKSKIDLALEDRNKLLRK